MPNIKITVEGSLVDGHKITFKAPCNCDVVEKLDVRYIENNTQKSRLFTLRDSHGNDLTGLGNLFSEGAYVDVVLDINKTYAYVQNASTNAYLEGKITPVDNLLSDSTDLPLSAKQGKVLKDSLSGMIKFATTTSASFTIEAGGIVGSSTIITVSPTNTDYIWRCIGVNTSASYLDIILQRADGGLRVKNLSNNKVTNTVEWHWVGFRKDITG